MSRIEECFNGLKAEGRKALIPFITAGDPEPGLTVRMMHRLADAGADIIELGVPFSDPMADGPVIQRASERALKYHVSLSDVIDMVSEFRSTNKTTPVVLMGYLNPLEIMGYETFAERAGEAGVDGVITVDMPPEESEEFIQAISPQDIAPIFLFAPTTTEERMDRIASVARGFIYYVSLKGVTGSNKLDVSEVSNKVDSLRRHTDLPVAVGFGIKDAETASAVAGCCDAVVVGSALVQKIESFTGKQEDLLDEVHEFLSAVRQAMDQG